MVLLKINNNITSTCTSIHSSTQTNMIYASGSVETNLLMRQYGTEVEGLALAWCCLRLESPTRSLTMDAPSGVLLKAMSGNIEASTNMDFILQSSKGLVRQPMFILRCHGYIMTAPSTAEDRQRAEMFLAVKSVNPIPPINQSNVNRPAKGLLFYSTGYQAKTLSLTCFAVFPFGVGKRHASH